MTETVYLAGGINNLSDADACDWRDQVKVELDMYYEFLDPMRRDYRGKELDDNVAVDIVTYDLEDIDASDIVLVLAQVPSWGTAMEMFYAAGAFKKIVCIYGGSSPSPWLMAHSHVILSSVDEAIIYLEQRAFLSRHA